MTKNLSINFKEHKIIITSAFAKKASHFNSKEYEELMKAQEKHPSFEVTVKDQTKRKSSSVKGITREFMYDYAEKHEKEDSAEAFAKLKNDNATFASVKSTFLKHYPEFKDYKTRTQWILAA